MATRTETLRLRLAAGPQSGSQLAKDMGISQPTVSRTLAGMNDEVMQIGAKKNSRYLLRDAGRGFTDIPVFRVDAQGKLTELGVLTPVRPDGFVFTQTDGLQTHSDGLPWWLLDMLPQGYLGRAYASRYAASLGLPPSLNTWSDSHSLRALLVHGHDMVGNLLLGPIAREKFIPWLSPCLCPWRTNLLTTPTWRWLLHKVNRLAHLLAASNPSSQPMLKRTMAPSMCW